MKQLNLLFIAFSFAARLFAQQWTPDGTGYYAVEAGNVVKYTLPERKAETLVTKDKFIPKGSNAPLAFTSFQFSENEDKILLFTNTRKVWRYHTRGDYWVLNKPNNQLQQLGKGLPEATLMFAKFSPDGTKAAYVSARNIYVEDLSTGRIKKLTDTYGTRKCINGTFDWAYEEEFDCRDGFRWSPDGKSIAYWQIDANKIRDFYMINNTDSIYPFVVPVEYPVVGEFPSPFKIGVVNIKKGKTQWMELPVDARNSYAPRMEWLPNSNELLVQHLSRKQNNLTLFRCDAQTGKSRAIYNEQNDTWIDVKYEGAKGYWDWLNKGTEFVWVSEKGGWRQAYRISSDGKTEKRITQDNFDLISVLRVDEAGGYLYYSASPGNATQSYLFRSKLDGSGRAERLSPVGQSGTHNYSISLNAHHARHRFSNHYTPSKSEWISLPDHQPLAGEIAMPAEITPPPGKNMDFFQVTTPDGVTVDGYIAKPKNFDPTKKYPILFQVYTEPAGATVRDVFGLEDGFSPYDGNLADDQYIIASLDGRGTPAPKGSAWRHAIYRNIGRVNIRDQAMGAQEMFKRWPWIDTSRVAVWGWSGGGSATLNLLFQYPDIYKTGISVAAVADQRTYDNIYQERYMGLPQENDADFIAGSPLTYAKNLRGNLLYIHGTGDDNVHYKNAELLINELITQNKYFQLMAYPNRTHSINEGEGTTAHLSKMFSEYLRRYCPGGGRAR